jgi:NAD(P)-dependent dehydrogenase (short-subunit alcohol dehydrogenase family)
MEKRLQGKAVLVTGAALGFGAGIARALGRAGAHVLATDVNDANLARSVADMKSDGSDVVSLHLDAADLKAFQSAVNQVIEKHGRIDAVVHAGVIMPLAPWESKTEEQWWREMHISFGGYMNTTRAAWEAMKSQGGGHIIGIASGSSFRGYKNEVVYCAGKHAIEGFIKALALEAAPYKISLNAVGPGKRIKPTALGWEQLQKTPPEVRSQWFDADELGKAFVWLIGQPPGKYTGLRFDAGPIYDTIAKEGWDFKFAPEKVTTLPDDMKYRMDWHANYDKVNG